MDSNSFRGIGNADPGSGGSYWNGGNGGDYQNGYGSQFMINGVSNYHQQRHTLQQMVLIL